MASMRIPKNALEPRQVYDKHWQPHGANPANLHQVYGGVFGFNILMQERKRAGRACKAELTSRPCAANARYSAGIQKNVLIGQAADFATHHDGEALNQPE
jgi:hypothetical protein